MKKKHVFLNIPSVILIIEVVLFIKWSDIFLGNNIILYPVLRGGIMIIISVLTVCCNLYLANIEKEKNAVRYMCHVFLSLMTILITPVMVMIYLMSISYN